MSFAGGSLWARGRMGVALVRIDPTNLQTVASLRVEDTPQAPTVHAVGRVVVVNVGYADVAAFDVTTSAKVWQRRGTVFASRGGEAVIASTEEGDVVRVTVDDEGRETGRRSFPPVDGLSLLVEDEAGGAPLLLTGTNDEEGVELRGDDGFVFRAPPGAFQARRNGALVAFQVGGGSVAVANLTTGQVVHLGAAHATSVGAGVVAVVRHGALTLVTEDLVPRRVALPLEGLKSVALDARSVFVANGDDLFAIDRQALEVGDQALVARRIGAAPTGDATPARVVFAGASTLVALEHPRYGRLNVTRPPDLVLAKGDEVILDLVVERPAGVFKVEAWHKAGAAAESAAPAATDTTTTFPVAWIAEGVPALPPPPPPVTPELRATARKLDVTLPQTLTRVFELYDDDAGVRRDLDRCSFLADLAHPCIVGADPCVWAIAGNGNGDVVGLYVYPPAIAAGAPLPVVDVWHETSEVSWLAEDFDRYWEQLLVEAKQAVANRLRARVPGLGLGPAASAPPWFLAVHDDDHAPAAGTDLLARERQLVRALREAREGDPVFEELASVYEALGWTWHRQNLLAQID